ncbi:DUF4179 domain-containing protein [Schinkia azotoformans]|uniref:DUF4179 domain-containing protein n=1 Tax=Schinkia azotoformans TaxID=1454 RepID=UPI002E1A9B7E|nr:DUF4179 domain-containing protein [Schinkia azotoformans]
MNDKIKQELHKIEIPTELHERSKVGIKKAKTEQQKKKFKGPFAAAAVILGLSAVTVGFAFPTAASNLPIIGDIFKLFGNESGIYNNYKEFSTEVNTMKESNGIKVTVNDAIFDGETVTITYSIISDHDLGEEPIIFDHFDIQNTDGIAGTSKIEKISENEYVGLMTGTYFSKKDLQTAKVTWEIKSFKILNGEQDKEIKGHWGFAFNLDSTDSQTKLISQSVKQEGIRLNIKKMVLTPMSFILYYEQGASDDVQNRWHQVYVDLEVKDDLGNIYTGEVNGGSGTDSTMNWSKTFEKLNPNASKLIVTPHVMLRNSDTFTSAIQMEDGTMKETKLPEKYKRGQKDFVLENIIIDLTN